MHELHKYLLPGAFDIMPVQSGTQSRVDLMCWLDQRSQTPSRTIILITHAVSYFTLVDASI